MLRRLRGALNSVVRLTFRLQVCNAIPTVIALFKDIRMGLTTLCEGVTFQQFRRLTV